MDSLSEILNKAQLRAEQKGLPYSGALSPKEAYELLRLDPSAKLVDVRTQAEWDYVGKVPGSVQIEWQTYPGGRPNPAFLDELKSQVDQEGIVMFLCRSGVRSHAAAIASTQEGFSRSFNILEGFEGDKDAQGHRSSVGGWKLAGLPWVQG